MAMSRAQILEQRFGDQANAVYEKIMDMNVSMSVAAASVNSLMNLRNQLLTLYGVPPDPKWKPASLAAAVVPATRAMGKPALLPPMGKGAPMGKGKAAGKGVKGVKGAVQALPARLAKPVMEPASEEDTNFKSKLNEVFGKTAKRPVTKEDFVYTTTGDIQTGFVSTLVSPSFEGEFTTAEPCHSKKAAEAAAAKALLMAHFPQVTASWSSKVEGAKSSPHPESQKRKLEAGAELSGKPLLLFQMQLLLGGCTQKGDILFETAEIGTDPKTFQSTLTLPNYSADKTYTGNPAVTKKDAEISAAEIATQDLAAEVAPLIEEHRAKKARKAEESNEKMRLKREEYLAAHPEEAGL